MSLMLNTGAMQYKADGSSGWQPLTLVANVDLASLADAFSESSTYEVGEYVRRDSRVYRCITAIQTAGAWDSTKWTEVTLADEIHSVYGELKTSLSSAIIMPTRVNIPSSGQSSTWTIPGLTANHRLVVWGFSSSGENAPPCNLSWETGYNNVENQFRVTNDGGTTSETIRPIFVLPTDTTAT